MTRETLIYFARVYISEARRRRSNPGSPDLYFALLRWATTCRLLAMACPREPHQLGLFQEES